MGILLIIDDSVYIYICNVYSYFLKKSTKHAFVYDSNLPKNEKRKHRGEIIDNISDAPI